MGEHGEPGGAQEFIERMAFGAKPTRGLSSDCTLDKLLVVAILLEGREHPCDRCNEDRKVCRGYPRQETRL